MKDELTNWQGFWLTMLILSVFLLSLTQLIDIGFWIYSHVTITVQP